MDAKEALERLYPAMQDAHVQRSKFYAPRGPVKTEADADNDLDLEALAVLRAVVDERDALTRRAEALDMNLCSWMDAHKEVTAERDALKAELAAARPLLDAVVMDKSRAKDATSPKHCLVIDAWASVVLDEAESYRAKVSK